MMSTKVINQIQKMKTNRITALSLFTLCMLLFSSNEIKAQQEMPDNIKDHILQGITAFESAKTPADIDKALSEFNEAARLAPDFADVHYYLGKTYSLLQGNAGRATNEFKKYLELYPDAPEKEEVTNEIARLEKVVESKRLATLVGIELMELPDGIYVRKLLPYATGGRATSRNPTGAVMAGDKLLKANKTDISGMSLNEVLSIFDKDPDVRYYPVTVLRGGREVNVLFERSYMINIDNIKYLGEQDLAGIVKESPLPVIAIFWKTEDPVCRKLMPDLAKTAYACKETVRMYLVNVDENVNISAEYNVKEIPSILFFREKTLIGKIAGYQPELFKEKAESIDKITKPFGLD